MPAKLVHVLALVIVEQDARGIALFIIVLIRADGPDETDEAKRAQDKRDRDENDEDVHLENLMRWALSRTVIEEADIARAAANGVAYPASAMGIAIAL